MRYARIDNGVIVEFFETEADISTLFHEGLEWILLPPDAEVGYGWQCVDGEFLPPPPPPHEQLVAAAIAQRAMLLDHAERRIRMLQWSIDAGEAGQEENGLLLEWKRYALAIERIESQDTFPESINWPAEPA